MDLDFGRIAQSSPKTAFWWRSSTSKGHRRVDTCRSSKLFTEGDGEAYELAKHGAMMGGEVIAQIRGSVVQPKREEVYAARQNAASFDLSGGAMASRTQANREVDFCGPHYGSKTHRMEWCAAASKHCCMMCGRSSKLGKCQEHVTVQAGRARIPTPLKNLGPITVGHGMVTRVEPNGETLVWCRKVSCCTRCRFRPELMNLCRPAKTDTEDHCKMLKLIWILDR